MPPTPCSRRWRKPRAHVILILTADSPEQLLPTIVSRCEVIRLRPLPVEQVEAYLKEHAADEDSARLLAHISGGRPGYALRLMQDPKALDFRTKRLEELNRLLKSTRRARFAYAEKLTDRRKEAEERFRETLQIWLSFWRDVLLCTSGAAAPLDQRGPPRRGGSPGEKIVPARGKEAGQPGRRGHRQAGKECQRPPAGRSLIVGLAHRSNDFSRCIPVVTTLVVASP